MMKFLQKLLIYICKKTFKKTKIKINNIYIDFRKKIKKIKLLDIINKYSNLNINENTSIDSLIEICKNKKIKIDINKEEKILDNIFNFYCKNKINKPVFIIDYPIYMSPLAKSKKNNNKLTERFELYINNIEIANSYTELNDPIEQYKRFKNQQNNKIDKDFIKSLKIGMPPTVGIGIGIDRLIALLTNNLNIQEVILFPQMK